MPRQARPRSPSPDVNAVVSGYLRDLAFIQKIKPKTDAYKRAAGAINSLEFPLTDIWTPGTAFPKIPAIGPSSERVIKEVLETGKSPTAEAAIDASGRRAEVDERRASSRHFLSRAEVIRILGDDSYAGPKLSDYRADFQMHSEWSDGAESLATIADTCRARGYTHAAITDHSHGLKIARGMTMQDAANQRRELERVNAVNKGQFTLLQGIEANIGADGSIDVSAADAGLFDMVLAAPHSALRTGEEQTARLLAAVRNPVVRVLAHPRGRVSGSRAGLVADWPKVFAACAAANVAVEIDGAPSRQDLDHVLARSAFDAGCLIALDSDAHGTHELVYAETAIAHARLAAIPADRIINCWPLDRLLKWLRRPVG